MSIVVVIPSIVPDYTQACLATIAPALVLPGDIPNPPTRPREVTTHILNGTQWRDGHPLLRLVIVYNAPEHNLGVAGSWNVGIDETLRIGADWLLVLSAGIRFGKAGGTDLIRFLTEAAQAIPHPPVIEAGNDLGWHAIAFHRETLELVGRFDGAFHPAYFEDNDWSYRYQLATGRDSRDPAFEGPLWPKVTIDAKLPEVAHGIIRSGVEVDFVGLEKLYMAKWGGKSPGETFTHPYNDAALDWTYVGTPPRSLTREFLSASAEAWGSVE